MYYNTRLKGCITVLLSVGFFGNSVWYYKTEGGNVS
jgi:hypothetical protein